MAVTCAVVCAFSVVPAVSGTTAHAANQYQNIVVLGDSVSSGYSLGENEAGYYDILEDCTGGTVKNYAIPGITTKDLLADINLGDFNLDGAVSADDAQQSLQGYVNKLADETYVYTDAEMKSGDVNFDNTITSEDAQYILQYYISNLADNPVDWYSLVKAEGAKLYMEKLREISSADLICISIGGNDLMQPSKKLFEEKMNEGEDLLTALKRIAKEERVDDLIAELTKVLRTPRNDAKAIYPRLESVLRNLNPDATVVMQTIYNPMEVSQETLDSYLKAEDQKNYTSLLNYIYGTESFLNKAMQSLSTVQVADVNAAFKGYGWLYTRFSAPETKGDIHPNAAGHALIAAVIMDTLGDVNGKSTGISNALNNMSTEDYNTIPADTLALMKKYS